MKLKPEKTSITTQIVRVAWVIWASVISVFFVYNYQINTTTFESEQERNFNQTSQIVKQLMEQHLQSVQVSQDITSRSRTLIESFQGRDFEAVDSFMQEVEEFDPTNTPDIRFLYQYGRLAWADGRNQFFGISNRQLLELAEKVDFNHKWYFLNIDSHLGLKHLMLRRVTVVDSYTGEVVGHYFIGLVLDDNLAFLRELSVEAIVREIMLVEDGTIIASSAPEMSSRIQSGETPDAREKKSEGESIAREVVLKVDGVETPISALFIQDTTKLEGVEYRMATSLILLLITVTILAFFLTRGIRHRIDREIMGVLHLADSFDSAKKNIRFKGSNLIEFDRLGSTLEASIRREKEKDQSLRNLFQFSLLPTLLVDETHQVVAANPAARKAFCNDLELLRESLLGTFEQAFENEAQAETSTSINDVIYSWSVSPILVDDTRPLLVVQGQNITRYIEAERQSERAREEAERNALARAEFLAKVSHEIRTPLNGIMGMAQLLKQEATTATQKEQTSVLFQSSKHLLSLLNDILDFSRIDKGAVVLEQVEFSLQQTAENISSFAEPNCIQKGLKFSLEQEFDEEIVLRSDPLRLTQILLNLITNAIKFTQQGEVKVIMGLRNRLADRAELFVRVQDNGIGIAKERQEAIFSSFTQAESYISREFGGSGLGLSIVKSLVSQFSGHINVTSELGKGSEFKVSIPVVLVSEQRYEQSSGAESDSDLSGLKVLLVEDNKTNAFVVQSMCLKRGLEVDWVADGLLGLDSAANTEYDLILMDNQMPRMDGIDATIAIRQKLGLTLPIIACTADGYDSTAAAFIEAGANQVLVKPILEAQLFETIAKVMER